MPVHKRAFLLLEARRMTNAEVRPYAAHCSGSCPGGLQAADRSQLAAGKLLQQLDTCSIEGALMA